jgi:hypothetical protein
MATSNDHMVGTAGHHLIDRRANALAHGLDMGEAAVMVRLDRPLLEGYAGDVICHPARTHCLAFRADHSVGGGNDNAYLFPKPENIHSRIPLYADRRGAPIVMLSSTCRFANKNFSDADFVLCEMGISTVREPAGGGRKVPGRADRPAKFV